MPSMPMERKPICNILTLSKYNAHVCKGAPSKVSAKFWIKDDEIIMEHNDAQIPAKDLKKIQMYISLNKKDIIYEWFRHFGQ